MYDNVKFGLDKVLNIYDKVSNRAFVFLVEAGFSKIPPEKFLGSDQALISGDYHDESWGHSTRNINMSLRFAQLVGQFAVLSSIEFDKTLNLLFDVYGCSSIDQVTLAKLNGRELSRQYDPLKNLWQLAYQVDVTTDRIDKLKLKIACDQGFKSTVLGQKPQSHFVKMKTDPDYYLEYKG